MDRYVRGWLAGWLYAMLIGDEATDREPEQSRAVLPREVHGNLTSSPEGKE